MVSESNPLDPNGDANTGPEEPESESGPRAVPHPPRGPGQKSLRSTVASRTEWLRGGGSEPDIVLSSRVRLARNLAGFPFMPRASRSDRQQILDLCRRRIVSGEIGDGLAWISLHEASKLDRSLLAERHLISRQHAAGKLSNGCGGPKEPRGVAFSARDERLSIMVNEEDHLRLQVIHSGLDLSGALAEVDAIDDRLEATLDFAFSPRFGYLTACPTNVGTGLRLSVMLHLPALRMTGELDKVKNAADDMSLAMRGFYGEGSESAGDFYQLSNNTTLGKSERVLLRELESEIIPQVISYEQHARRVLLDARKQSTADTTLRALGVLMYARLLTTEEAMQMLSRVRLGVMLGLIDSVDLASVNQLMLLVQPAHLQAIVGRELDQRERRIQRAEIVRQTLRGEGHGSTSA